MNKNFKKFIYFISTIILVSIIGGIVKYSVHYMENNPEKYILNKSESQINFLNI